MEVILNVITNFEGTSLKPGDEIDVPRKIAERWINRGIAHYPIKDKKKIEEFTAELKTSEGISIPLEGVKAELGKVNELAEPIKKSKRKRKKKINEKNQYGNSSKKRFGVF